MSITTSNDLAFSYIGVSQQDTICARATPPGKSALAVLRLSGPRSLEILKAITNPGRSFRPREAHFVRLVDGDELVDEAIVIFYQGPKSFTGEDLVELMVHGSPQLVEKVLQVLQKKGSRLALPGEFSARAFLNGKIDLAQAESVQSLIASEGELARKEALKNLSGWMSEQFSKIESDLIWCLAHIEAGIDFSEADIVVASGQSLRDRVQKILLQLNQWIEFYQKNGMRISDGYVVVLSGSVNVGKSTLLNVLAGEERAIVSSAPGTTRDIVRTELDIAGFRIVISDTAGIRDAQDVVERIGVERAIVERQRADLVFLVVDAEQFSAGKIDFAMISKAEVGVPVVIVLNKSELLSEERLQQVVLELKNQSYAVCAVSAKTNPFGAKATLLSEIKQRLVFEVDFSQAMTFNARQIGHVNRAQQFLQTALSHLLMDVGGEFVAIELRSALEEFYRLVGKSFDDDVLDRVFKEFCLGK